MNDPFADNPAANWIAPFPNPDGCANYLEVGDPLFGFPSGYTFLANGYTLQDEAFLVLVCAPGALDRPRGRFDCLGLFTSPAQDC